MKPLIYWLLFTFTVSGNCIFAQIKIGTKPTSINPNAIFELESSNKGMLLPRVDLSTVTFSSPPAGLIVYNTASTASYTPGIYYHNGTSWIAVSSANVYTSDGTINNNRVVTMADKSLSFSGSTALNLVNTTLTANSATPGLAVLRLKRTGSSGLSADQIVDFSIGKYTNSANAKTLFSINLSDGSNASGTTNIMALQGDGKVGIGTTTPASSLDIGTTDAVKVPVGNTAQRPIVPTAGMIRYNSDLQKYEGYNGTSWVVLN